MNKLKDEDIQILRAIDNEGSTYKVLVEKTGIKYPNLVDKMRKLELNRFVTGGREGKDRISVYRLTAEGRKAIS